MTFDKQGFLLDLKHSTLISYLSRNLSRLISLRNHPMFWPLLVGLLLRLALAPWTEQRWDSYTNRLIGSYVLVYGINPFLPDTSCNCPAVLNYSYPPLWLWIMIPMFGLWLATTSYIFPSSPASLWAAWGSTGNLFEAYRSFIPGNLPILDLLLKTPVLLSDVAIGYLIWLIGGRTPRAAKISLLVWIFNPYVITMGSVWGVFDSIAAMFLLLSVYYLQSARFSLSGISLAMGVATKLFPAIVLFPAVFYLLLAKRSGLIPYVSSFLVTIALTLSSALVFPHGFDYLSRLLIGRSSPNYGGTPFFSGLTWMLIFNDYSLPVGIPVFFLILPVLLVFFMLMFRKSLNKGNTVFPFLSVAFLGVYLSYPSINPQYAIWILPMLAVLLTWKMASKWSVILISAIPLTFVLTHYNPLYLVSPALIFNENNYLPASDVVKQLWNFPPQLPVLLAALFTITIILTIDDLMTRAGVLEHSIWRIRR